MIAVDSNILVYAHRADSPWHQPAAAAVRELAEGKSAWAIPWPCIHEFLAIVTHKRIYDPPTPLDRAREQVEAWFKSPTLMMLAETESYWKRLRTALEEGRIRGPRVHDARIAAICTDHGVKELLSADRDFSRFPSLKVRNPVRSSNKPRQ